ncbi:putative 2-aminoethylphosphonate ABC transporter ATP-binding protein [Azospirillum sp. TSA2s]|uniref:putative 2-aminoethylphosphonate ABC transporter ATP-binding protein n=1 Tax=Azospirillum sp. TSA2s TaxID=709810 RepID=UPI0010AA4A1D|nr:putative 2-aminoethylphosphonate ABC transporter ATP-binding protein [Azospirillum sp. TSA2s]QCG94733.1 putative 2-aminoethylphosphonate ABC transporter ATP-binding protein [Azospirillum sp. TSA2s]
MTAEPLLRLDSIVKNFGTFTALKGVSLDIRRGEFICFLGPSGCGKTTLLRVIAGLDPQSGGAVWLGDRDVSRLPPSARDYGIVFQSYALFPNLTVHRNVAYGLKLGRAAERARVEELLALVGLPDAGPKYPAQLSGGQQQRVALARALAPSPGLLLLDEPLSALDARVRLHLRRQIRELHRRLGITTIMVTHDQEEALTMADRIVVMNNGVIEQVGAPDEVYRRPASPFVADFVGAMNFLPGVLEAPGRVRLGDHAFECGFECDGDDLASAAPGAAVTVCLRPEDVQVRAAGGANTLEAVIESLEFLGPFHRARLAADGLGEARVTADLSANLVRDMSLESGRRLAVTLPRERLRVFEAVR